MVGDVRIIHPEVSMEETMRVKKYWLMKSEPSDYSFEELKSEIDKTAEWDGVRNYQARNLLRDEIKIGDEILVDYCYDF